MKIRLACEDDTKAIIELIDQVLGEWEESTCCDGSEADLRDIQGHYFDCGGAFWVLVDDNGEVVGSHGAVPASAQSRTCYFRRLYVRPAIRGTEWTHRLMQNNLDWAMERQFERVEFWSDVRFERAHRFFEKFGFRKTGQSREMTDSHLPYEEFFFYLDLPTKSPSTPDSATEGHESS